MGGMCVGCGCLVICIPQMRSKLVVWLCSCLFLPSKSLLLRVGGCLLQASIGLRMCLLGLCLHGGCPHCSVLTVILYLLLFARAFRCPVVSCRGAIGCSAAARTALVPPCRYIWIHASAVGIQHHGGNHNRAWLDLIA